MPEFFEPVAAYSIKESVRAFAPALSERKVRLLVASGRLTTYPGGRQIQYITRDDLLAALENGDFSDAV